MSTVRLFSSSQSEAAIEYGVIKLGDIEKKIPYKNLPDGSGKFMYLNLNEHDDFIDEAALLVAIRMDKLKFINGDGPICYVTPEASTIRLTHTLKDKYGVSGLVIHKSVQTDDVDPISIEYTAITSTEKKHLYLCKEKAEELRGKNIVILDSICTSGSTIRAVYQLLIKADISPNQILEAMTLFTEGEKRMEVEVEEGKALKLYAFSHLPLIKTTDDIHRVATLL